MISRSIIVDEARSWIGTPFHWEASVKGVGCDCRGMIAGVARNIGAEAASSAFASMGGYHRRIDPKLLQQGLEATFDRTADPQPGDVLLLKVAGIPQHLAILTESAGSGRMVHTYGKGPKCVIETPMGSVWWAALVSSWMWRGLENGRF